MCQSIGIPPARSSTQEQTAPAATTASAGTLPTIRLGRSVRVARVDLDAYIQAKREAG